MTEAGDQDKDAAAAADWAAALKAEEGKSEADLAADWEAAAGGAENQSKVLNQNEIDSLLGVVTEDIAEDRHGLKVIVNSNSVTYERLPMLEVVFDRFERMLTTAVRNFTSENVDIILENIAAQRFGDYLNSVPLPAMIGVFKAVEWDGYGLITVDSPLIYSVVDVLLGGRQGNNNARIEGRPYTTIELSLVERLVRVVLEELTASFAPVAPAKFELERIETNPRFAAVARPNNVCVVFRMRLEMQNRGGLLEFVLPYGTLEPVRDKLMQMFMGEKFGRDPIWEEHLASEISRADVELEAVLGEQAISLDKVMNFKVGSILYLGSSPDSKIDIRCGGISLLKGKVGRAAEQIAIEIE